MVIVRIGLVVGKSPMVMAVSDEVETRGQKCLTNHPVLDKERRID